MSLIAGALLLPLLFWTKGPESAPELVHEGVKNIAVPANLLAAWKSHSEVEVTSADLSSFETLQPPGILFHPEMASATREPWVNSNGWHYLRRPDGRFFYDVPGPTAELAAAEAFTFGGQALIKTDEAGLPSLARMLTFLSGIQEDRLNPVVNVAFVDDGSSMSAECMNLLIRRNLLVGTTKSSLSGQALRVAPGSADYPKKDASNPVVFAQEVREHLTDEKRSLRIYGSNVVVGRLAESSSKARVFLINYGTGKYSIEGIRVRVLGRYSKAQLFDSQASDAMLMDALLGSEAAEFTVPTLKTFAVVDLYK